MGEQDIAESVGIPNLKDDVATSLAQDVEYRIHEIVQEAMKFMRHGKRTKLTVDDINNALRVRNVEVLCLLFSFAFHKLKQKRKTN
jgi:transcription initiation factor TFIID subunit 6